MPVPHVVARVNAKVTDRFVRPIVRRSTRYAVVHHVGRRSARAYETPVVGFDGPDGDVFVVLTYGRRADWIRNALVGPASLERHGRIEPIHSTEVVDRSAAWGWLPVPVRLTVRLLRVHELARLVTAVE